MKSCFFIGKGGVGKSTSAAIQAIMYARSGNKTLLVSLDSAHNLSDIFEQKYGEEACLVQPNLYLREIDSAYWMQRYLKSLQLRVQTAYRYLTAFNLEQYFDILQEAPGTEEFALLQAYREILKNTAEYKYILFDMPPTAVTLKFFSLPALSIKWLNKLQELRGRILQQREIASHIRIGQKTVKKDSITTRIEQELANHQAIASRFSNIKLTEIHLVVNPDQLALKEGQRIARQLQELKMKPSRLILNKAQLPSPVQLPAELAELPLQKQPIANGPLTGLPNLVAFTRQLESAAQ